MSNKHFIMLIGGLVFGFGLALGHMTEQEVILSFLRLQDLGLLLLMGTGMAISSISMIIIASKMKNPVLGGDFFKCVDIIDKRLVIGAVIFGIGWGISGLCPGSAIASIGVGNYPVLLGILSMFIGAYIHGRFLSKSIA